MCAKHAPPELLLSVLLSSMQAVLLATHTATAACVCTPGALLQGCLVHNVTADNNDNSSNSSPRLGCWAAAAAAGVAAGVCPLVEP